MSRIIPLLRYRITYASSAEYLAPCQKDYCAFTAADAVTMWEHDSSRVKFDGHNLIIRSIECLATKDKPDGT